MNRVLEIAAVVQNRIDDLTTKCDTPTLEKLSQMAVLTH